MNVLVRDATPADADDACAAVRRSISELCVADHGDDAAALAAWLANKTPENFAAWAERPGLTLLVAICDDAVAGVAAMTASGRVTLNYVSPERRFRGVSKALMAALEARARACGLAETTLESSQTARRFYRALGYAPDAEGAAPHSLELRKRV